MRLLNVMTVTARFIRIMKGNEENWLSGNVFFLGFMSLLSDASDEMAAAILLFFLIIELAMALNCCPLHIPC